MSEAFLHYPSLDGVALKSPSCASHHLVRLPSAEELRADADVEPIISVVTPCYNDADVIEETALSVLSQTIRNLEWIIVDDGSNDDGATEVALGRVAARDPRVRIERQENAGPAAARNRGVRLARSEFILFNDSDDLLEPTFAEKLLLAVETFPGADWAWAGAIIFGTENFYWINEFAPGRLFEHNICSMRSLVRKAAHERAGGFDEEYRGHEDWDYWVRHAAAGNRGVLVREFLEHHRYSKGSRREENMDLDPEFQEAQVRMREKYLPQCEAMPGWRDGEQRTYPIDSPVRIMDPVPALDRVRVGPASEGEGVLVITNHFATGGADRFTLRMMEYLHKEGAALTVAMTQRGDNEWVDRAYALSRDVFHLPDTVRYTRWIDAVAWLIRSRGIRRVVVTQSVWGYHAAPILAKAFPDVAFFDYSHCVETLWIRGGYPRLAAIMAPVWSRSYASSEDLRDTMARDYWGDPSKIGIVRTGIDIREEFNPENTEREAIRREMDLPDDRPVILHASRMSNQKRPEAVVAIAEALRARYDKFLIVALGAPDKLLENMKQRVERAGLEECFRLLPPDRELARYMAACDVFLLPSFYEGLALTLPEALGMGMPVVASDVGGQRELLRDDIGWMIPLGDPEEGEFGEDELAKYVDAVCEAIEGGREHPRAGENARRRALEMFDIEGCMRPFAQELLDPKWLEPAALASRTEGVERIMPHAESAYINVLMATEHDHLTYDWEYAESLLKEIWAENRLIWGKHVQLGKDWEAKEAELKQMGRDWERQRDVIGEVSKANAELAEANARMGSDLHHLRFFVRLLNLARRVKRGLTGGGR